MALRSVAPLIFTVVVGLTVALVPLSVPSALTAISPDALLPFALVLPLLAALAPRPARRG